MEEHCEPRQGSKGYKSDNTTANVHVVNLYNTGAYVVNGENKGGGTFDSRYYDYYCALHHAQEWMRNHE